MMNHVAVVLRGHLRTWFYIYPAVFDFYKSLAYNIDYYFVTWDTPSLNEQMVIDTFKGEYLVKFLSLPIDEDFYNSWIGPGWMCYNILPFKHEREKNVTYDAVFDSRPDVLCRSIKQPFIKPESNSIYTTSLGLFRSSLTKKTTVGISDWFLFSDSKSFDKISERYKSFDTHGCQVQFRIEIEKLGINLCVSDCVETAMIRPNSVLEISNFKKYFDYDHYKFQEEWINLNSKSKEKILKKFKINKNDDKTGSLTCSI